MSHKQWFFTPEYPLKPPFHGGNMSSNLVRDANILRHWKYHVCLALLLTAHDPGVLNQEATKPSMLHRRLCVFITPFTPAHLLGNSVAADSKL